MYTYSDIKKIIFFQKDCEYCIHYKTCKFVEEIKKVSSSSLMYSMNEYLESNNIFETFSLYTNCRYFERKTKVKENTHPDLSFDKDVISHIIYQEVYKIEEDILASRYMDEIGNKYFFFQPDLNIDIEKNSFDLILKTTSSKIGHGTVVHKQSYKIDEILNQWTFKALKK